MARPIRSPGKSTSRKSLTMEEVLTINNDDGSYDVKHRNVRYYTYSKFNTKIENKVHKTTC